MEEVYLGKILVLEDRELQSSKGQLSFNDYCELLALYLLHNDLANAKALWNRTPEDIKILSPEYKAIWEIGKAAWRSDYENIYRLMDNFQWTEPIKSIITKYKDLTRQNYLKLVSRAYTVVEVTKLSELLGLTNEDTLDLIKSEKWELCEENKFVKPKVSVNGARNLINTEDHLEKLTRYILFLET